jgi:hypothetical protein
MQVVTAQQRSPWIAGPRFDLVWFFGGAALALAVFALAVAFRASIVAIAWIWVLAFDGPHMMALYTRTYLDREAWRTRRPLLLGALALYLVGPAFLVATTMARDDRFFLAFLAFASTYGYYHVVRQHYGFVALYRARSGEVVTGSTFWLDKATLYLGLWLPWLHFLVAHPIGRALVGSPLATSPREGGFAAFLVAAWAAVVLAYAALTLGRGRSGGLKAPYLLVAVGVHGLLYFVASRFEPVYAMAKTVDQQLLLMSVMGGMFHSAQYVGIVWLHNARTYGKSGGDHGLAARASASLGRYLVVCLAFSALYLVLAAATAVYPAITLFEGARLGPFPVSRLALCLFWGIALQHYVIDQRIWRIKKDAGLRDKLAGAQGGSTPKVASNVPAPPSGFAG